MKDITFWPTDAQMPRVATVYARGANGLTKTPTPNDTMSRNVYFRGSGGLYSTAEDYIPLGMMLANGGELNGKRLLSRKTVEMMSAAHVKDTLPGRPAGEGYGLSVRVVTDHAVRGTMLSDGTFGWTGAQGTHFFVDPKRGVGRRADGADVERGNPARVRRSGCAVCSRLTCGTRPEEDRFCFRLDRCCCADAWRGRATGPTADRHCCRYADRRSVHLRYRRTAQDSRRRCRAGFRPSVQPGFLPDGDALVTERGTKLRIVRNATGGTQALDPEPVSGLPAFPPFRTGGLQEVALHPQFATNRLVYFTYNKAGAVGQNPNQRQSAVTLARGRFDGKSLTNVEEFFTGDWNNGASGSRLAFGRGLVYMTTGAPFDEKAQSTDTVYGKVLRLTEDGKSRPTIRSSESRAHALRCSRWDIAISPADGSRGDRQRACRRARAEWRRRDQRHSARTQLRLAEVQLRTHLRGPADFRNAARPGIDQPLVLWIPSIAPTGLTFYTADRIPAWKGNLFVGSARRGEVPRTGGLERVVVNDKLEELRRESLLTGLHQRIRDVRRDRMDCSTSSPTRTMARCCGLNRRLK